MSTPTALVAPAPAAASNSTAASVRISTGVTPVQLVYSAPLATRPIGLTFAAQTHQEMVVELTVNEKGQPQDVRVVQPVDSALDAAVVDAVRQYRYRPATLDNQPIAAPVRLTVQFER